MLCCFRLILDIVASVGGFHFVDAASVPGRQWLRYVVDTSWFHSSLNSRRRFCLVGGVGCCGAEVSGSVGGPWGVRRWSMWLVAMGWPGRRCMAGSAVTPLMGWRGWWTGPRSLIRVRIRRRRWLRLGSWRCGGLIGVGVLGRLAITWSGKG